MIQNGKIKARIGVVGPGKMGEAILGGVLSGDVAQPNQIYTYARRIERRHEL